MGIFKDLTGETFGKLTVIRKSEPRNSKDCFWECRCECGRVKYVSTHHLNAGSVASCGCLRQRKGSNNPHWKGWGEISATLWRAITRDYKNDKTCRSKKRLSLKFDINIRQAWGLFLSQNRKCALTGLGLSFGDGSKAKGRTASLDRIDSNRDYTLDNVQWVHKVINNMKQSLPHKEFVDFCCKVAEHHGYTKV